MTHYLSSSSIHQISTPTSVTYNMLYNRSLPGWLPIFSLSTLLKLNFFLLNLNNNSLKYRTALSLQPTLLATLVLFLTNTLASRTKSLHFLNLVTITSVNFALSAHTLTSKQPAPLPPLLFILNFYHNRPNCQLNRLQQIQNSLARAVVKAPKSTHHSHSQISALAQGQRRIGYNFFFSLLPTKFLQPVFTTWSLFNPLALPAPRHRFSPSHQPSHH